MQSTPKRVLFLCYNTSTIQAVRVTELLSRTLPLYVYQNHVLVVSTRVFVLGQLGRYMRKRSGNQAAPLFDTFFINLLYKKNLISFKFPYRFSI